ncbi:MAG: acyltransferase family protein [Bacillota bacterium]|nr:acyltransferase family protein [Bacillota bacterium]
MREKIKERDYMFDTFRSILMLSIPVSHFTKASANWYQSLYQSGFAHESFCGFMYITINVFVMPAFMFLSGYFSQKPDRARETAFRSILWPYLVFTTITMIAGYGFDTGIGHWFSYLTPPFALWFLFALFLYRFFLRDIIKFPWALPMSIIMMFAAGALPFNDYLALGRVFSYFPFFLIGYYCSKETLDRIRTLKRHPVILVLLAAALVGCSIWLVFTGPRLSWFLLKDSAETLGVSLWDDFCYRGLVFCLACGWITLMVNILPSKRNFLCYVGTNTMPIYIFHLGLRHIIKIKGLYLGAISALIVAWFSLISLTHHKHNNWPLSVTVTVLSIAGAIWLWNCGLLDPLVGKCPKNLWIFYPMVYGSALLTGISLCAPFWVKLYDILTEGFPMLPFTVRWLQNFGKPKEEKNAEATDDAKATGTK